MCSSSLTCLLMINNYSMRLGNDLRQNSGSYHMSLEAMHGNYLHLIAFLVANIHNRLKVKSVTNSGVWSLIDMSRRLVLRCNIVHK